MAAEPDDNKTQKPISSGSNLGKPMIYAANRANGEILLSHRRRLRSKGVREMFFATFNVSRAGIEKLRKPFD